MTIPMPTLDPCPFCLSLSGSNECVFVHRDPRVASFVNPSQHSPGSLLVIPVDHFANILDLPRELAREIYAHAHQLAAAAVTAFGASGVNVFQNNGVDAGQQVPHYHVHVIPRYPGDDPTRVFQARNASRINVAEQQRIAAALHNVLA